MKRSAGEDKPSSTLTYLSHPLLVLTTVGSTMLTCGISNPIRPSARRSGLALHGIRPLVDSLADRENSPAVTGRSRFACFGGERTVS